MKLLFWNIRGIKKVAAKVTLSKNFRENSPDLICIAELMIPVNKFPMLFFNKLGFASKLIHNDRNDSHPNLWILWKQNLKKPLVFSMSEQHISFQLEWNDRVLDLSVVHAKCPQFKIQERGTKVDQMYDQNGLFDGENTAEGFCDFNGKLWSKKEDMIGQHNCELFLDSLRLLLGAAVQNPKLFDDFILFFHRNIWFEAATVVAVAPPVEIPAGSVLKSALAGGLACALSTSLLHPVDTMKTRVQASTLSFPELVSKLPQIGVKGLYRGSIPAILGQFSSHGLRTGVFEASKLVLVNVAPTLPEIQVQSVASFCSTILGTAVRIPCEVLKQRLQAGIFNNVGEAVGGTLRQDGLKGFFRGTGATLFREVPFYVAGMGLYAESKKVAQQLLKRDLEPWETIVVGALSGGFAAVVTTPFDVMKTRMMTAPQGLPVSMSMVVYSILHQEGPLGLFKGALPRFFWIAPLGAMNFAGYELAKKAMDKTEEGIGDQLPQKG
ncbi:S-adenosylmethionine mitochondrial carrier protein-like [Macadamia integrifolia]|uniref:S-adenosylmethionine mitochondrial carrier protein-like n=1 Tax=Macadamia integrifolia TaxID=60698 RepID=UPI001C4F1170|nr:S-adenosylmethionine mitochondrial carrier protein-like [Macadamia integrifolia]